MDTIDKLGSMTPEQLQEIPGVDPEMVETIRDSVTAYYGQYEEAPPPAEETVPADEAEPLEAAEAELETELSIEEPEPSTQDPEPSTTPDLEPAAQPQDVEMAGESDTIIDSGRVPHDESEDSGKQE